LKIELNKGRQSLFWTRESLTIRKLKLLNFDSFIKMELLKAFYFYTNLKNQFQIFIFEKRDFFRSARTAQVEKQTMYLTITFDSYFQMS